MSTLKVPGAHLSYEVNGAGPFLILIPGAAGTGEVFRPLAHHLISQYQVVTYDRRGFSRSSLDGPQDYEHRLATGADDVRRLLEHLTDQPATVIGLSSGAIVALEVISHSSAQVQTVVANAPPAVSLLPDAAQWLAFFDGVYETYRKEGVPKAMHQFASGTLGSIDRQVIEHARYWMEHELRKSPRVELHLAVLEAFAERIVLVGGRDAQDQLPYQPNEMLARQLGCKIVDFPGGHLGFVSYPAEFAQKLMDALKN